MWFSRSHENSQWTQNCKPPPSARTKKLDCVKKSYSKSFRLTRRFEYLRVINSKNKLIGRYICINYHFGDQPLPRLGVTVSAKFGNAICRNRFKRIAREAFRHSTEELPPALEINISPRRMGLGAKSADIQHELLHLIKNMRK